VVKRIIREGLNGGIYLVPKKGTDVLKQLDKDIEKDYLPFMLRQPKLDAPGALEHMMGREIERIKALDPIAIDRISLTGWRPCIG
jgi:hypothetical protein